MAQSAFSFSALAAETVQTLFRPSTYFATMPKEGGFGYPLFKVVVYAFVSAIILSVTLLLSPTGGAGAIGAVTSLIVIPVLALIGIFISGAIMLVMSAICTGETKYEANFRAAASVGAMMIVQIAIFASGTLFLHWIVLIVSWIAFGYVLYLTYCALTASLKGNPARAKTLVYCIAGLYVVLMVGMWGANKVMQKMTAHMQSNIPAAAAGTPFNASQGNSSEALNNVLSEATKGMSSEEKASTNEIMQAVKNGDDAKIKELTERMMAEEHKQQ